MSECRYSWCPRTPIMEDDRFDSEFRLTERRDRFLCPIHAHSGGDEVIHL